MDFIKKLDTFLAGKKTYIGAAFLGIAVFAVQVGWIDQATFNKAQAVLIAWIGASLRASITQ